MKPNLYAAAAVLAAPLFLTGPVWAQQISTQDFVQKAATSDMFEIQSGKLAAEKAEHEDVREFGKKMADDHQETSEELLEHLEDEQINAQLPKGLDQEHQAKLDKLKGLSGSKFDQAYVAMQVQAHETAVNLFDSYAKNGDNEELKDWAAETLPALKEHLKEAKALNEDIKAAPATAARDENSQAAGGGKQAARSEINFVKQQSPSDWSAEALIGRTVENAQGENLGEINNVVLNEKGTVVAVTIGVGGFLGIGEKDVGVPFDALQFEESAADRSQSDQERTQTQQQRQARDKTASRFETEHDDIRIVLNATQEQLESAPQFVWLDEQDSESARDERTIR